MSSVSKMQCWEIMQCSDTENCPAREHPDIPCWELSEKLGISQSIMDVCNDCIVRVLKTNDTKLSPQELDDIITYRKSVTQAENCPVCNNPPDKTQVEGK